MGTVPEGDAERRAIAEAVDWVWQRWQAGQTVEPRSSGRRALEFDGRSITLLWRSSNERLAVFVAGAHYQKQHWFDPALDALTGLASRVALLDERGRVLHGAAPPAGSPETRRLATATGLPWTIVATSGIWTPTCAASRSAAG